MFLYPFYISGSRFDSFTNFGRIGYVFTIGWPFSTFMQNRSMRCITRLYPLEGCTALCIEGQNLYIVMQSIL